MPYEMPVANADGVSTAGQIFEVDERLGARQRLLCSDFVAFVLAMLGRDLFVFGAFLIVTGCKMLVAPRFHMPIRCSPASH